jgi:hypothetical protein
MVLWAVALLVLSSAKHTVSKAIIRLIFQRVGPHPQNPAWSADFSDFRPWTWTSGLGSEV